MAAYKNDYLKNEDFVLWRLHEIRNKMAKRKVLPDVVNRAARQIILKYHHSKSKLKMVGNS